MSIVFLEAELRKVVESTAACSKMLERYRDSGSHYSLDTVLKVLDDLSERNVSFIDYREEVKKALLKKVVPDVEGARSVLVPPSPKESGSVSRGGYKKIPANTPLSFKPDSHKRGKAATRYELYKGATTVGEYKQLNNTTCLLYTSPSPRDS